MSQPGSVLWPKFRVLQVYGANTGVGKTIFSSVLCRAFLRRIPAVKYLKPVSTGPLSEADNNHISKFESGIRTKCLFQFDEPVSPHIAVRSLGRPLPDETVVRAVHDELRTYAKDGEGIAILETAGGVLSPAPSGSSQADLYRTLRLPTILIGDHQLGGIGTTISAWESLHVRGYDVQSVALFSEGRYDNHTYLKAYFADRSIDAFSVPPPPERLASEAEDERAMSEYYEHTSGLEDVAQFTTQFLEKHDKRISSLRSMPEEAEKAIWHPFMQHSERSKDTIMAWDSAYGDHFQSYSTKREAADADPSKSLLQPAFDGSASWWTQGLGHGNPRLALTAAHAAGRYGHVMFGGAIHEPALELAQTLLRKSGNPRLTKVFYSDNGSTGMEVAVKMALRAASLRYGDGLRKDVSILGLKNSYHGDTIGAMDCSEPSIFNEKVAWYSGRGVFLDFPTVKMRRGRWQVEPFADGNAQVPPETRMFNTLDEIFDFGNRHEDAERYRASIRAAIHGTRANLRALIIEPVLLGAGGMLFADPLYQRCLVQVAREVVPGDDNSSSNGAARLDPDQTDAGLDWRGMPVIFDEIFAGLYRLGRFSAASFLGVRPDIVANAKLLTGGLLPLCTTMASEAVFAAFLSADKTDALLHGHSYTANPIGCAVANASLRALTALDRGGAWDAFREDWGPVAASPAVSFRGAGEHIWSMWSQAFVAALSHRTDVDHVFALGSVLAISMKDPNGSGYASTAATGLRDRLLAGNGVDEAVVHSRVLGNVLYLMAAPTTPEQNVESVEKAVLAALD